MLANLLTTLILAIGIATGNVSSNSYKGGNAFNYEEKIEHPTTKRATETITNSTGYISVGQFTSNTYSLVTKFYLENIDQTVKPTWSTGYYNVANTTYSYRYPHNGYESQMLVGIYQIYPYFNFNYQTVTITQNVVGETNYQNTYMALYRYAWTSSVDLGAYLDLTLNESLPSTINALMGYESIKVNPQTTSHIFGNGTWSNGLQSDTNTYTTQPLIQDEPLYIVMASELVITTNQNIQVTNAYIAPTNFSMTGTSNFNDVNYEVVDIPNLMFTILTLPFSFISTAFNVTLFPGTPYAINFGNITYTIIAAFILLFIIKKIFK